MLTLVLVGTESVVALAIVVLDGAVVVAAVGGAALAGGWLLRAVSVGDADGAERLVYGTALGIGAVSLIMLAVGSAGLLSRPLILSVTVALAMAGVARAAMEFNAYQRRIRGDDPSAAETTPGDMRGAGPLRWSWLLVVPFAAIGLCAAALPPGLLWAEEAGGYDVLEYHLAVPKEFLRLGAITFLPHNAYSNFPLNYEMLAMWMMSLRGDPISGCYLAVMVNVLLAGLLIAAAWLIGRRRSPRAGVFAGLLAATTPWVWYLAGIAYVEPGMLAMGMAALAALLRAGSSRVPQRWCLLAGLLAGLSCGFKYPAVVLIAMPLALLVADVPKRQRYRSLAMYALGAAITFAPWMIRNTINTGNPVFPLATGVFGARTDAWNDTLAARWARAHGVDREQPITARAGDAIGMTLGDWRLGAPLFVLAGMGVAARRRDRTTLLLALILAAQLAIWFFATHLFARFIVVCLLPLIGLASGAAAPASKAGNDPPAGGDGPAAGPRIAPLILVAWGLLLASGVIHLYRFGRLYYDHTRSRDAAGAAVSIQAFGRDDWFVRGEVPGMEEIGALNNLPDNARVMLVGEARTFYIRPECDYAVVFSPHPLAGAVRRDGDAGAVLDWLRGRGVDRLLVHWSEMSRLRRTYGFPEELNEDLFVRLEDAGLEPERSFALPGAARSYATLYRVPAKPGTATAPASPEDQRP